MKQNNLMQNTLQKVARENQLSPGQLQTITGKRYILNNPLVCARCGKVCGEVNNLNVCDNCNKIMSIKEAQIRSTQPPTYQNEFNFKPHFMVREREIMTAFRQTFNNVMGRFLI